MDVQKGPVNGAGTGANARFVSGLVLKAQATAKSLEKDFQQMV
jgi:hypothetical protein